MPDSTLTKLAPTQVELVIPILPDEMRQAEERAFRRLVKKVKLPGFRPGKVPRKLFEQTYGTQTITEEAMEDVVPAVYAKAVREHDLAPVDRPKMELLPEEDGQPKRVKAVVDVRPQIVLGEYKGLALKAVPTAVTDAEVENALHSLARDRATLVPAERAAREGDVVTLDYDGTIDGERFDRGSAAGAQMQLGESRFIPGFAEGIAGMSPEETKEISATFPLDYERQELAGKSATFKVTLREVKELELPPLDDAFAQAVSQHQTLDDLRADIRRRLEAVAKARERRDLGNQAVEQLIGGYDFPLPEVLVEREIDGMLRDAEASAARVGVPFDQYLERTGKTLEGLRQELRPEAQRRVKATLLLEEIAKAEEIRATPGELKTELASLARQYGQPVERVRQALGNNVLSLMDGIARTKTVEFLVDHANVA